MKHFLFHLFAVAVAVAAAAKLLPGVEVKSWGVAALAALVLGVVNAVVRPVLRFLTFPLTVVTLGLFYLVLNGICFALVAWLVPGFTVSSLGTAFAASVIVWGVSTAIGWFGPDEDDEDED